MSFEGLTEVATWATALATLIVSAITCYQVRHSRLALGVDTLLKLESQFNSPEMRIIRAKAATGLQKHIETDELYEVLGFFETVGLLSRKKAIDAELLWHTFMWWLTSYYQLCKHMTIRQRLEEADPTYWSELEHLVNKIEQVEKRRRGLRKLKPIPAEKLSYFLASEAALVEITENA